MSFRRFAMLVRLYLFASWQKNITVNEEVLDEAIEELGVDRSELEKMKTAEVGNILISAHRNRRNKLVFTDGEAEAIRLYGRIMVECELWA